MIGGPRGLRVSLIVAVALAAGISLVAPGCGCGGGNEPPPVAKGGGGKKAAANDPAAKEKRKEIEKAVATIAKALSSDPLNWDRTVADCEKYEREANEIGAQDLVSKLQGMRKDAKEVFERAAEKETKEACEGARKYIAEGDLKKARNRAVGLHRNIQKDDRYWSQAQKVLVEIAQAERAERYYTNVTKAKVDSFKRIEDWERAQGVLEAFLTIPAFQSSPRLKDVNAALAEVKPGVEKVRAARASEQKIRWVPAFKGHNDDLFKWELSDHQSCTVAGELLTFRNDVDDPPTLAMMFGKDDWEDYIVEMQIRLDKGTAFVNFRGYMEGAEENQSRNWQEGAKLTASDLKEKDRFYKLRFEVRAGELRWTAPGSTAPTTKKMKGPKGPFEIRLPKGSQVTVKTIWVKVLKPAGASDN